MAHKRGTSFRRSKVSYNEQRATAVPLSPTRKKMRLSSPTFDDQMHDFEGLDDILEKIEFNLSQSSDSSASFPGKGSQGNVFGSQEGKRNHMHVPGTGSSQGEARRRRQKAIAQALGEAKKTDENAERGLQKVRMNSKGAGLSGLESVPVDLQVLPGFALATSIQRQSSLSHFHPHAHQAASPPLEEPHEQPDFSTWFEPAPADLNSLPGFQRVSAVLASQPGDQSTVSALPRPGNPMHGFLTASDKSGLGIIEPSKAALELAAKKMQEWQEEDAPMAETMASTPPGSTQLMGSQKNVSRAVLGSIDNSHELQTPDTPSPAGNAVPKPLITQCASRLAGNKRGFKSPLMNAPTSKSVPYPRAGGNTTSSPLNPNRAAQYNNQNTRPHPLASTSLNSAILSTPVRTNPPPGPSAFVTPVKRGLGPPAKPKFATPFKLGMKPGQPGRVALDQEQKLRKPEPEQIASSHSHGGSVTHKEFVSTGRNLNVRKPTGKTTLQASGLRPQQYSARQLGCMGVDVTELRQINVETAIFYSFPADSPDPPPSSSLPSSAASLGSNAALEQLLQRGCNLATKEWVDNHWRLILWKLAGMACLEPEREMGQDRRWCWNEVMRQLSSRYERELDQGSRPPFKLITTRDAPASSPMVLCVSNITWSRGRVSDDGVITDAQPELEVTDGWYRLRAQVDAPLARAIGRGLIAVGRKLAMAGVRLNSTRKDPEEILQSYHSTKLILTGNSTHLAPWHTKLGFQGSPFVATLRSLTPDGGLIPIMNLTVLKVYPIAFFEFRENEKGQKTREGPRCEAEEAEIDNKWKDRRDAAEAKLRDDLSKRWSQWDTCADRLEWMAGEQCRLKDDETAPDHVEDLFDELECATDKSGFMKRLTPAEAGWLADFLRRKCRKDQELAGDEIELELKSVCPPREVRNFRVIVVQDTQTGQKPALRKAQLTVWDVLSLSLIEGGKPGAFDEGQRLLVTNLFPTQPKAWTGADTDSEVYLSTRRDTRWIRLG